MTADAAEREAFERHFHPSIHGPLTDEQRTWAYAGWRAARAAIPARAPEIDAALREAERLAMALHAKHYGDVANWKPLSGDLIGLLSQIDNMTAGLPLPARAPEGWVLVPREPTPEMDRVSAMKIDCKCGRRITQWGVNTWPAMLSASPPPPEQKEERDDAKVYADFMREVNAAPMRYDFQTPKIGSEGQPYREPTEPPASPAPGPAEPEPVIPSVRAEFTCKDSELIGAQSVGVKRVTLEDDGTLRVELDYWPAPAQAAGGEAFGTYVERSDGVKEFRRTGEPHSPSACAYKAWRLYTAPPTPDAELEALRERCAQEAIFHGGEVAADCIRALALRGA